MITLLSECIFVDHALNKTNTIYCKKLQLQKEKETSNFEVQTGQQCPRSSEFGCQANLVKIIFSHNFAAGLRLLHGKKDQMSGQQKR